MSDPIERVLGDTAVALLDGEAHAPRPPATEIVARGRRAIRRRRRVRIGAGAAVTTAAVAATVVVVDRIERSDPRRDAVSTDTAGAPTTVSEQTTATSAPPDTGPATTLPPATALGALDWRAVPTPSPGLWPQAVVRIDDRFLLYTSPESGQPVDGIWSSPDGLAWTPERTDGLGARTFWGAVVGPRGIVAIPSFGAEPPLAVSWSADGLDWETIALPDSIPDPPGPYLRPWVQFDGLAATPSGYVLVATLRWSPDGAAIAADLTDWAPGELRGWGSAPGGLQLHRADGTTTFVSNEQLGSDMGVVTNGPFPTLAWRSPGGRDWLTIDDPTLVDASTAPGSLVGGPHGFLIAVHDPATAMKSVLRSVDGITWDRVDGLALTDRDTVSLTADEDGCAALVAHQPDLDDGQAQPVAYQAFSSPDGLTWTADGDATLEGALPVRAPVSLRIGRTSDGGVATTNMSMGMQVAGQPKPPELAVVAWWSADLRDWRAVPNLLGDQAPNGYRIATDDRSVVVWSPERAGTILVGTPRGAPGG
jgi:hypothetical protein